MQRGLVEEGSSLSGIGKPTHQEYRKERRSDDDGGGGGGGGEHTECSHGFPISSWFPMRYPADRGSFPPEEATYAQDNEWSYQST